MDLLDSNWLVQLEVAVKVAIAGVFSGAIGFERELANRPAGLRTHAILGSAAALLVGASDLLITHFTDETIMQILRVDPIRIVEAVVTGTAFIGAGTIFRHYRDENAVEGLTTAASLLLSAGIGVVVAMRQLLLAACVTVLTLILLRSVRFLRREKER